MALYGPIGGNLPFGGAGGVLPQAGGDIAGQYRSAYGQALDQNKTNYSNILKGYQQTLASQQAGQAQTLKGYRNLQTSMLGDIANAGTERGLQIGEQADQQRGSILNRMIGSGLGNSSMLANFTMASNRDEARARNELAERLGAQRAGIRWQTGSAAQAYRGQANSENAALSQNQLSWMNSTSAPFPDAGLYSQLASQSAGLGNSFQAQQLAGGGLPQTSPGLLPSTMSGRPIGGYGPSSPSFYASGGGGGGDPMSGASLQTSYMGPQGALMNTGGASPAWGGMASSSAYGRDSYGGLYGNMQTGPQGGADYSAYLQDPMF